VLTSGTRTSFQAVVIEAGTAVREDFFMLDDDTQHHTLSIPIMVVPAGAVVVKTVAMAAPATIYWSDDADHAIWGVDSVRVEEDMSTRQLSLVADIPEGGESTNMPRICYHITIFIQGRKYIADPDSLAELELQ
jgi:hypothetical protein